MTNYIDYTAETKVLFEHSIDIGDWNYLVIFGVHVNGGFICIPTWNIGCEASIFSGDKLFNISKLKNAGCNETTAEKIADYINQWLKENQDLMNKIHEEFDDKTDKRIEKILKNKKN